MHVVNNKLVCMSDSGGEIREKITSLDVTKKPTKTLNIQ